MASKGKSNESSSAASSSSSSSSSSKHFTIRGVNVAFPCKPYPSQFSLMDKVITGCKNSTHGLLESPTGSGKSLALLCSSLAWQRHAAAQLRQEQASLQETLGQTCFCSCHFRQDEKETDCCGKENTNNATACSSTKIHEDKTSKSETGDNEDDEDFKPSKSKRGKPRHSIQYDDEIDQGVEEEKENRNKTSLRNKLTCKANCCDNAGNSLTDEARALFKTGASTSSKQMGHKGGKEVGHSSSSTSLESLPKIYFGTRTHKQISQIVREFKKTEYSRTKMTILASREHTCIEPEVSRSRNKNEGCNEKMRKRKKGDFDGGCSYYEDGHRINHRVLSSNGFGCGWDLEDLLRFGKRNFACPFFTSKALREDAEIIFCPYNYLIDPFIRSTMEINLSGHVVILDEAHNMEDTSREAASMLFKRHELEEAFMDLDKMVQAGILPEEHARCKLLLKQITEIIDENSDNLEKKTWELESKVMSGEHTIRLLSNKSAGPGEFSSFKNSLNKVNAEYQEPSNPSIFPLNHSTVTLLKGVVIIFTFLFRNECKDAVDYKTIVKKVKTRQDSSRRNRRRTGGGNAGVWLNSTNNDEDEDYEFHLHFLCLNPAVAFVEMAKTCRSVILASGTLSPMDSFQSELGLTFVQQLEANHVIIDKQVLVSTVGSAPNGTLLKATHANIDGLNFQDGLGDLVGEICARTPHGVLCFFSSYSLMNKLTKRWQSTGLWRSIGVKKKIFAEPRGGDKDAFDSLLSSFYNVITETDAGPTPSGHNGALLFAVCRGKVSEGMDFTDNNARAVITVGIPYPSLVDTAVMEKKKYNNTYTASRGLLNGDKWYEIQAYRALNQALGRCLRHKNDWGALILIDSRFKENPNKFTSGLSKWVKSKVTNFNSCVDFLRELGEFQIARKSEDIQRKKEEAAERIIEEESSNDVTRNESDASKQESRTPTNPDAPLYSIFTTVTPKRPPPMVPETSTTSSYFPSPATGAFPSSTPVEETSTLSSREIDGRDDGGVEERDDIRYEFERMKAEVEAERTVVENERKRNQSLAQKGKTKFDWRAKRDEAMRKKKEREEERIRNETESNSTKESVVKQEVIDDDDYVSITKVTKAKSWSGFKREGEIQEVVKSSSSSVIECADPVQDNDEKASASNVNNRKRLLFAQSPAADLGQLMNKNDADGTLVAGSEMDLFTDGTDDDEDMFAATRQLERSIEKEERDMKEIDVGNGKVISNQVFSDKSNDDNSSIVVVVGNEPPKGGVKRCLSSDSPDKDDASNLDDRNNCNLPTPVKKEVTLIYDEDDFVSKSGKKPQRRSLKRFKKAANSSWTSDENRREETENTVQAVESHPFAVRTSKVTTASTKVTNSNASDAPTEPCSSEILCASCGGAFADSKDELSFHSVRFSLPFSSAAPADLSTLKPLSCLHKVLDISSTFVGVEMKRPFNETLAPLAPKNDELTGLPSVLWAENLGCALKSLGCVQCLRGRRQRNRSSPGNLVAFEIMNDSQVSLTSLSEGMILFQRSSIRVCPERVPS